MANVKQALNYNYMLFNNDGPMRPLYGNVDCTQAIELVLFYEKFFKNIFSLLCSLVDGIFVSCRLGKLFVYMR